MNFSKTTEYALRILSLMSKDESRLFSANEIYDALKIPYRYLRKQLTILSKNNLLTSIQGKEGGYKLSKATDEISLYDIVVATGDNIIKIECFFGFGSCALIDKCSMHDKWSSIQENINNVLLNTKLADLKKSNLQNKFS